MKENPSTGKKVSVTMTRKVSQGLSAMIGEKQPSLTNNGQHETTASAPESALAPLWKETERTDLAADRQDEQRSEHHILLEKVNVMSDSKQLEEEVKD